MPVTETKITIDQAIKWVMSSHAEEWQCERFGRDEAPQPHPETGRVLLPLWWWANPTGGRQGRPNLNFIVEIDALTLELQTARLIVGGTVYSKSGLADGKEYKGRRISECFKAFSERIARELRAVAEAKSALHGASFGASNLER